MTKLINLIYQLSELENNMKWSTQKTIMFQAGIIKLCDKQQDISSGIESRIEKIEKYLKSGNIIQAQNNISQNNNYNNIINNANNNNIQKNNQNVRNTNSEAQKNIKTINTKKTVQSKNYSKNSQEYWPQILGDLKQNGKIVLYTNLINTQAKEINDMTVGIEFPDGMTPFGKTILEKQENIKEITNLVSMACGKPMQIKYIVNSTQTKQITNDQTLQNLANESDIPFTIE